MTRLIVSLETPLPREQAFAYVSEWSRQAEWDPNTVTSNALTDGPPAVGARYALEVKMGPKSVPMEYRITELETPSRIVLVGEGSGIWSEDVIEFTESPAGTRVDYQADIKLSGWLGRVQPLLGRAFDTIGKGVAKGMKGALDSQARHA